MSLRAVTAAASSRCAVRKEAELAQVGAATCVHGPRPPSLQGGSGFISSGCSGAPRSQSPGFQPHGSGSSPVGPGLSLGTVCPRSVGLVRTEAEAPQQGGPRWQEGPAQGGCGDLSGPPLCPEVVMPQWASGALPALGETLEGPPGLCLGCHPFRPPGPSSHAPPGHAGLSPLSLSGRFPPGLPAHVWPQVSPGHCPLSRPSCECCSPSCVP